MLRQINNVKNNASLLRQVSSIEDKNVMNKELDRLINTVHIFYSSKDDFQQNFPASDDVSGKMKLILYRRKQ